MTVELAEVAAGLPVALSFALAGGISTLREGRRRSSLNEAMHELRRPLQALALALPERRPTNPAVDSSLSLAVAALSRLDREINGLPAANAQSLISPRPLIEECVLRWRAEAATAGGYLQLIWGAGDARVEANPIELAQAVDNLISNAIEHGGGKVEVEARKRGSWLSISVSDSGGPAGGPPPPRASRRRGHGLRVVARVAHSHGGSFALRRQDQGMEATLRLPLPIWEGHP